MLHTCDKEDENNDDDFIELWYDWNICPICLKKFNKEIDLVPNSNNHCFICPNCSEHYGNCLD